MFMEIDLNHAVSDVENGGNACCDGHCEKGNGCLHCLSSTSSNSSSSSSSSTVPCSIYSELWHACAGRLTSLPKKGNVVLYFPQGHLEQVASASPYSPMEMPTFDLPPQIFCRVVNVQLLVSAPVFEVIWQLLNLASSCASCQLHFVFHRLIRTMMRYTQKSHCFLNWRYAFHKQPIG